VIAEASPSAGPIMIAADALAIARRCAAARIAAISALTDESLLGGRHHVKQLYKRYVVELRVRLRPASRRRIRVAPRVNGDEGLAGAEIQGRRARRSRRGTA